MAIAVTRRNTPPMDYIKEPAGSTWHYTSGNLKRSKFQGAVAHACNHWIYKGKAGGLL